MIGISMARVSSPSSGSWKAIGAEIGGGEEAGGGEAEDDKHDDQDGGQPDDLGAEKAAQAGHALPPRRAVLTPMPEVEMAIRMIAPMSILKA